MQKICHKNTKISIHWSIFLLQTWFWSPFSFQHHSFGDLWIWGSSKSDINAFGGIIKSFTDKVQCYSVITIVTVIIIDYLFNIYKDYFCFQESINSAATLQVSPNIFLMMFKYFYEDHQEMETECNSLRLLKTISRLCLYTIYL